MLIFHQFNFGISIQETFTVYFSVFWWDPVMLVTIDTI